MADHRRPKPRMHNHSRFVECSSECPVWDFYWDRLDIRRHTDSERKPIEIFGLRWSTTAKDASDDPRGSQNG